MHAFAPRPDLAAIDDPGRWLPTWQQCQEMNAACERFLRSRRVETGADAEFRFGSFGFGKRRPLIVRGSRLIE